ncbi:hypothetical protein JKP88DRAFT_157098 [Tribonema minus]|uniref:Peptidyl-Asp metalloendopeptidase n=1 Tax=Tribonema minus TaxID=303371 RepID=A0A836CH47_9STRA|nr:hypothetical protein JKP88DRAFT_157098 [Tribonema minus]
MIDDQGSLTVVWNVECDPEIFHFLVSLGEDEDGKQDVIRSIADCDGESTWIVSLKADARDEYEPRDVQRILHEPDQDIAALSSIVENGDVYHHDGAVILPSGRRLDDGSVIRVLFAYTTPTRDRWGQSTIRSMIVGALASANQALSNSGVGFKIAAARIMHVNWNYDNEGHVAALNALSQGEMPGIAAARKLYKADLVQVVIDNAQYCGFGSLMQSPSSSFREYAYSVVYGGCFAQFSHIHEIGHNMGARHDVGNTDASATWPYAMGYRYCSGEVDPPYFRSVMSYSCTGAMRVPYFSSPTVYYQGRQTGMQGADNARVLRETKYIVANFYN